MRPSNPRQRRGGPATEVAHQLLCVRLLPQAPAQAVPGQVHPPVLRGVREEAVRELLRGVRQAHRGPADPGRREVLPPRALCVCQV